MSEHGRDCKQTTHKRFKTHNQEQFKNKSDHVPIFDANQAGKMNKISEVTSPEFLYKSDRY